MKQLVIFLLLVVSVAAYGQEQPRVVEQYDKHAQTGNFLTRWYQDLRGTSTLWKEHLTLYDDQTYRYTYQGGECGTFDKNESGRWEKSGDFLLLNGEKRYAMWEDKLYLPETPRNEKAWVMKK